MEARSWPAEWQPQAATWVAWPHNRETWPRRFEPIPRSMCKFIAALSEVQTVHVLSGPPSVQPSAADMLRGLENVQVHPITTNDAWIRDFGPTFVRSENGRLVGVDWKYNAWGAKYPPFDHDALAAAAICRTVDCIRSPSPLYCEGGALESDGRGTLLTTSSCLLNANRNPEWSRSQVQAELNRQLGVRKVIWVDGGGLQGDDTDGHIDQLARFVRSGVVVAATASPDDANFVGLQANHRILADAEDAEGNSIEVIELPIPPGRHIDGTRVPESYCNFLLANELVIVPTFRHQPSDQAAIGILRELFPDRTIVAQDAYDIAWGLGAFHCLSQQQPA